MGQPGRPRMRVPKQIAEIAEKKAEEMPGKQHKGDGLAMYIKELKEQAGADLEA